MTRQVNETMNDTDAGQQVPLASTIQGFGTADARAVLDLVLASAKLLFVNGQSTQRMAVAVEQLSDRIGIRASVFPRWGELTLRIEDVPGPHCETVAASPASVDMHKVVATTRIVDLVCDGRIDAAAAKSALEAVAHLPPVSTARFALMAAAGAAALGVIFGAAHVLSLIAIGVSAGAGACLRRWLAGKSDNLFVQPLSAALLAGVFGAVFVRMQLSSALRLIAVCPCMVLVPGPHFLNGGIDLVRGRISLGAARVAYASLITAIICAGLLMGLALVGVSLAASGPSHAVPVEYDVVAAGVAVAAYGTFFAMPWRILPVPILVGMLAHSVRWVAITQAGVGTVTGAFVASLMVGILMTPIADYLRLPFAGLAFASVVSLVPGIFLFRMAGGMVELVTLGTKAPQNLFAEVFADGTTAFLVILAMTFGLIVPKMCIEHFVRPATFGERRIPHFNSSST
jgi:uncharacterized membrane protein YjjP (DUF1212 family)